MYLLKSTPPDELVQAVEQVYAGGAPMSMQIARKVVDHFRQIQQPSSEVETLTQREQEILELLAKSHYATRKSAIISAIKLRHRAPHLQHICKSTSNRARPAVLVHGTSLNLPTLRQKHLTVVIAGGKVAERVRNLDTVVSPTHAQAVIAFNRCCLTQNRQFGRTRPFSMLNWRLATHPSRRTCLHHLLSMLALFSAE